MLNATKHIVIAFKANASLKRDELRMRTHDASGVQHLEASSMAFMEINEDENRAAVGEDAGGLTMPNEVQVVNDTTSVDNTEAPPPTEI